MIFLIIYILVFCFILAYAIYYETESFVPALGIFWPFVLLILIILVPPVWLFYKLIQFYDERRGNKTS